jgi:hypothetical protein
MASADYQKSRPASRTRAWRWVFGILGMETAGLVFWVLLSILDPKPETIAVIAGTSA